MRMRQGVRTGLGHGGITRVLQTQFSSFYSFNFFYVCFLKMSLQAFVPQDPSSIIIIRFCRCEQGGLSSISKGFLFEHLE